MEKIETKNWLMEKIEIKSKNRKLETKNRIMEKIEFWKKFCKN
jgi:hypothetical protein